jgi:hypothetical protein
MFLADEIEGVDLRSNGGTRPTVGGRIRARLLLPLGSNQSLFFPFWLPPRFLLLVSGNSRIFLAVVGPRDQPSGGAAACGRERR